MQPLTQAAPPPPLLCSQAAEHFLVKLVDENFPWPSNIHYKPKSFMQKKTYVPHSCKFKKFACTRTQIPLHRHDL